jgi:glutamate-1-semialdehyde 2,1-aminomutase
MTVENPDGLRSGLKFFPGSSNGEYGWAEPDAVVVDRGKGSRLWDVNGREYLDMSMAWGSAILGHAPAPVLEAAGHAMAGGTNFACVNRYSAELAERIAAISPCVESIRFVASGTEATMMCCRVAREYTGRPKILRFEGAYHGQHPIGIASMVGDSLPPHPEVDPAGASDPAMTRDVLVAPYNDLDTTAQIIEAHAESLAGVIVEPLHRCITPEPGFLQGLREVTRRHGVVLIFDEVVTGFRMALGGAQEYYGVSPDLVAYGKGLGGGFPIGAFGGQSDIMEVVNEHRLPGPPYAWSASTTGGNPVSAAAALATINQLSRPGTYPEFHGRGARLRKLIATIIQDSGCQGYILGDGPLAQVAFSEKPVRDHRSWKASNRKLGAALMTCLLRQGVFLNPMGTKLYISTAHTDGDLEEFGSRFRAALHQALHMAEA